MDSLFGTLVKESNAKVLFEKKVFDVIPGQGAFHQQPTYVKKIIRKEHVLINGKPKVIRRVYCKNVEYLAYQNVGWVLFTDVQHCMLCQKAFPRFISRHMGLKKHCHICGNIVCGDCLNISAVRIMEFCRSNSDGENSGTYVDACSNCFWGQDEISISVTPLPEQRPIREVEGVPKKDCIISTVKSCGSSRSAPSAGDKIGKEEEENNVCIVQEERVQWERDESSDVEGDDEEYDIEVGADTTPYDSIGNMNGRREFLSSTSSQSSGEHDVDDIEKLSEAEVVSDANRVNLMMLLSTLSVVHDNNPNEIYNMNTGEECFENDNPDYIVTSHNASSDSEDNNDINEFEGSGDRACTRSPEMAVSLDDISHQDEGGSAHDSIYESAEDMARLNNWESFL